MNTISVEDLRTLQISGAEYQLIDVRELHEFENANIQGILIPLGEIPARYAEISKDKKVIIHCRSGVRSANAISFLEQNFGYNNLYNLEGGIVAWASEIDDSLII